MKDGKTIKPERPTLAQAPGERSGKILNREIQAKIGQQLRAVYNDVVDQGVPERFANLLRRLDEGVKEPEFGEPPQFNKDPQIDKDPQTNKETQE